MQPNQTQQPNQPNPASSSKATIANARAAKKTRDQRASVQNHLMFSEIKDGIVVMRDGSLRMVIMCSPVNFDLKSPQEQDSIEFAYQGFLNGLHFPIQIVVRSRKIDLDGYIAKLEQAEAEQENQLLAGLMEDYIYNIKALLDEVNIMKKEFYVVVPLYIQTVTKENIFSKFSGLLKANQDVTQSAGQFEQHKRDLVQRANLVAQGLAQMGIRAVVLSTQEVVELFYTAYNVDESQNQSLIGVSDMTTPVVEKGERAADQPAYVHKNNEAPPPDLFEQAKEKAANMPSANLEQNSASKPNSGEQKNG